MVPRNGVRHVLSDCLDRRNRLRREEHCHAHRAFRVWMRPRGATMTRKPEFLTKLLGAEVERSTAVTNECKRYPKIG